jgi:hypothetical protein
MDKTHLRGFGAMALVKNFMGDIILLLAFEALLNQGMKIKI